MKIAPLPQGQGVAQNPDEGRSAGADRIAKAKAAMVGSAAIELSPEQQKKEMDVRKIKMRTNATPLQYVPPQEPANSNIQVPEEKPDNNDTNVQTKEPEATKPLSPQFAALAKQKRALQLKEQEVKAREDALKNQGQDIQSIQSLKARLKSDPLSVLQEEGVTYDALTEAILNGQDKPNPALLKLEQEIRSLKEGLDNQNKSLSDRDQLAEKQVLSQIKREADQLSASDEAFEMIKATNSQQDVVDLIKRTFDADGYVMDTLEAMNLVEADLVEQAVKIAQTKKLQAKLSSQLGQQQQPVQQDRPQQMRTITARDGVAQASSPRERAIAAFYKK